MKSVIEQLMLSINTLAESLLQKIKSIDKLKEITCIQHSNAITMNGVPQDFIEFKYQERSAIIQIVKSEENVLSVVFFYKKTSDQMIFTSDVDEVFNYLMGNLIAT